jgi:hypothetical protein
MPQLEARMVGRSDGPKNSGDDDEIAREESGLPNTVRTVVAAKPTMVPSLLSDDGEERPGEAVTAMNPISSSTWLLAGAALPAHLHAYLEVIGGPSPRRYELRLTRTLIGRGEQADLRLDDEQISRKHACILYAGNEFRVRDDGSGNGTLLNGSRVLEYGLRNGDELQLGATHLRFCVESR